MKQLIPLEECKGKPLTGFGSLSDSSYALIFGDEFAVIDVHYCDYEDNHWITTFSGDFEALLRKHCDNPDYFVVAGVATREEGEQMKKDKRQQGINFRLHQYKLLKREFEPQPTPQ